MVARSIVAKTSESSTGQPTPAATAINRDEMARIGLPLARRLAAAHGRRFPPLADEFESAALVGLAEAIDRFDPGKGAAFPVFAGRRIRGSILDAHRQANLIGHSRRRPSPTIVSLDAPQDDTRHRPVCLADVLVADEEGPDVPPVLDAVRDLCRTLTARQKKIMDRLFGHAATNTMARTGAYFGVSESAISRTYGKSIEQLRRDLAPGSIGGAP